MWEDVDGKKLKIGDGVVALRDMEEYFSEGAEGIIVGKSCGYFEVRFYKGRFKKGTWVDYPYRFQLITPPPLPKMED